MATKTEAPAIIIRSVKPMYAKTVYVCEIPEGIRRLYRDQQIVNMVDGGGRLSQADSCSNFGGSVVHYKDCLYNVTVYTD